MHYWAPRTADMALRYRIFQVCFAVSPGRSPYERTIKWRGLTHQGRIIQPIGREASGPRPIAISGAHVEIF